MEYLRDSQKKVVSLGEAVNMIVNKQEIIEDLVVLTFDDGCERFYDITFPILDQFGFPCTIYPVAGCLGKPANWGKIRNPELKILSKEKTKELSDMGVEIGAHTMNHHKLTQLSEEVAYDEIYRSKELLQEITCREVNSFSYPHGAYNIGVRKIVKKIGFTNALTCIEGNAENCNSIFEVPRKYITYFDGIEGFINKIRNNGSKTISTF
ncbi:MULTISPECIES: polysaccharide deacetylase family protein [Sphingobacterium]|uniref:polysaccharide deacetylase family protein n=1 Tax=Sphingobacterium TaxID=28453 RepID=UPI001052B779|nr:MULTISPECIES: polysaccharide deacetylase family protein [Sphingobacterium]MCW2258608.1 peptidoglycan/xylan/chitin deacetylase (PgdA/CDA1 family) [Sphingobacterium kitahiroshimense]TCR14935.1 polysaccharide deacetylase [Sphingobacterium sp. JUb78]